MFETYKKDTSVEIRDETKSLIFASERRLKIEILTGVAQMLDNALLPQISDLDCRLSLLEHRSKLA